MKLGINLSFAAKRWQEPDELAAICAGFGVKYFQFNLDFINPWWPKELTMELAGQYRDAFARKGLHFDSVFGGMGAYAYPQYFSYNPKIRDIMERYHEGAIDIACEMQAYTLGIALGGMTHADAYDPERRKACYKDVNERLIRLAAYGAKKGLKDIQVEAVPLFTELPNSIESSLEMMHDLEGKTDIPVQIFLDWGHMLCKPFMKEEADMVLWINALKPYIGDMHLQQTDGEWDRHWDFRHEDGIVTKELIKHVLTSTGKENSIQYLEFAPAYEDTDENVYEGMRYSVEFLRDIFEE